MEVLLILCILSKLPFPPSITFTLNKVRPYYAIYLIFPIWRAGTLHLQVGFFLAGRGQTKTLTTTALGHEKSPIDVLLGKCEMRLNLPLEHATIGLSSRSTNPEMYHADYVVDCGRIRGCAGWPEKHVGQHRYQDHRRGVHGQPVRLLPNVRFLAADVHSAAS